MRDNKWRNIMKSTSDIMYTKAQDDEKQVHLPHRTMMPNDSSDDQSSPVKKFDHGKNPSSLANLKKWKRPEIFINLAKYILTITMGLSLHLFVVLPLIIFFFLRVNPLVHFKAIASAMLTAFSTSSSNATLPDTIKCVKENAKVSNEV